jgi:RNA polymerase sigma factor (TIGR02999 family)
MDGRVTAILQAIESGDAAASERLLPVVYSELRALAAARMAQESPGHTLNATALVHEAYLRLVGPDQDQQRHWDGRGHFFSAAAEAMRRILIDHARAKHAAKRGGNLHRETLDWDVAEPGEEHEDLVELDESLRRLETEAPEHAELVKLRFFAGLTLEQAARVLGVSPATADRRWAYARAWLLADLNESRISQGH